MLSIGITGFSFAQVSEPMTAKDWYKRYGQVQSSGGGILAASTPVRYGTMDLSTV